MVRGMKKRKFDVVKFLSRGSYSMVYEVTYTQADGTTAPTTWALKRFYLRDSCAVRCALREHAILVRLAQADTQSPFLVALLQSLRIDGAPALVLQKGSGFDLFDLISDSGLLNEENARFYSCEIICGLEHLHAMHIVHLDIKPTNILIADSGHLLISDFDHSYDMTRAVGPSKTTDFMGAAFFRAPEVTNRIEITTKADVWSLGIVVATIMHGYFRVGDWLKTHRLMKGRVPNASEPLRQFFQACLTCDHKRRLDIAGVKRLDFFKDVNWGDVVARKTQPPFHPSELEICTAKENFNLDPQDPLLLAAAFQTHMPVINKGLQDTCDENGVRQLVVHLPKLEELQKAGLTTESLDEVFANFDFTNPHYLEPPHSFEGN